MKASVLVWVGLAARDVLRRECRADWTALDLMYAIDAGLGIIMH